MKPSRNILEKFKKGEIDMDHAESAIDFLIMSASCPIDNELKNGLVKRTGKKNR